MKKLLKIVPFASLGIVASSVLAVLLCYVFRVPLLELVYHIGRETPVVIPVGNAVSLVGQLGAMIWLCVCIGNRRFGIWAELLAVVWLSVVLPVIGRIMDVLQSMMMNRLLGAEYVAANSYMNLLWSYATIFNGVAVAAILVACGFSMADKRIAQNDRLL